MDDIEKEKKTSRFQFKGERASTEGEDEAWADRHRGIILTVTVGVEFRATAVNIM